MILRRPPVAPSRFLAPRLTSGLLYSVRCAASISTTAPRSFVKPWIAPTGESPSVKVITSSPVFQAESSQVDELVLRTPSRRRKVARSRSNSPNFASPQDRVGDETAVEEKFVTVRKLRSNTVEWIDVVSKPTTSLDDYRDEVALLLLELGVHETLVENTLEAVQLPQTMILGDCASLILRSAVPGTTADMDSIQELTNRITVIVMESQVITIHRPEMDFLVQIQSDWAAKFKTVNKNHLVNLIVKRCVKTYQEALAKSILMFDDYESKLFVPQKQRSQLARQIYHIKRRASVYSRILALQFESYAHLAGALGVPKYDIYFQDVAQHIAHVRSLSDELNDNANAVLQLLFQLSSYQLNELMRVLTMFSAFFIPLSFITGVYGMNFENMPGAQSENGPLYCFCAMALLSCSLVVWFRAKGFW
jgi:magnesium transporter